MNIVVGVVGGDSLSLHGLIVIVVEVMISGGFLFGAPEFVEHGHVCENVCILVWCILAQCSEWFIAWLLLGSRVLLILGWYVIVIECMDV